MSRAGVLAQQGYEYQLRIAVRWVIRLLDPARRIEAVQVESTGVPGEDFAVTVDDVVVIFCNGRYCFVQAKKNDAEFRGWSLADRVLRPELIKAWEQLCGKPGSTVLFCSRSPLGEPQKLSEECRRYPDYPSFRRDAPLTAQERLQKLADIIGQDLGNAFALARSLEYETTADYPELDLQNAAELSRFAPRAGTALAIVEKYIRSHQAKLPSSPLQITRDDLVRLLGEHGVVPASAWDSHETIETFRLASQIGRSWVRTVAGQRLPRPEADTIRSALEEGANAILVCGQPGSGKTCLLLDLADELEERPDWSLLFIKGDRFAEATDEEELVASGLPEDIVGRCARLAEERRVAVILDSLDVLSISRAHASLKLFLGLVERLQKLEGVSVVAGCRDFDIRYDPLLRATTWEKRIDVGPLDYDTVIAPFLLRQWRIDGSSAVHLRDLLTTPQSLSLFEKLVENGVTVSPMTEPDLAVSVVEEVVATDDLLGEPALAVLEGMAEMCVRRRSLRVPRASIGTDEATLRRLTSQKLLIKTERGTFSFAHQSLGDCLVVRRALRAGKSLATLVLEHPPLPFIRPAVRAFFFHMRAQDTQAFRRQAWELLTNDRAPYHIKRLIAESLGEIVPVDDDWPLVRRFFLGLPDLFHRFFWAAQRKEWFPLFGEVLA